MSKVFSFRLDENNPREAQAWEVIEAWVNEGYSLRQIVIEAILELHDSRNGKSELKQIIGRLNEIFNRIEDANPKRPSMQRNAETLPTDFIAAIRNSAKSGIRL